MWIHNALSTHVPSFDAEVGQSRGPSSIPRPVTSRSWDGLTERSFLTRALKRRHVDAHAGMDFHVSAELHHSILHSGFCKSASTVELKRQSQWTLQL
uniref:Uncharacterized protein n=1 Tax=Knipowitschia caucasica TaxID=637954 RepID=A0AAV2KC33_KNICA